MPAGPHVYRVVTVEGEVHDITATWAFDNEGTLVLRMRGDERSEVVASFAKGNWASFIRVDHVAKPPKQKRGKAVKQSEVA